MIVSVTVKNAAATSFGFAILFGFASLFQPVWLLAWSVAMLGGIASLLWPAMSCLWSPPPTRAYYRAQRGQVQVADIDSTTLTSPHEFYQPNGGVWTPWLASGIKMASSYRYLKAWAALPRSSTSTVRHMSMTQTTVATTLNG